MDKELATHKMPEWLKNYDEKKFKILIPIHKVVTVPAPTRFYFNFHFNKWEPSPFIFTGWGLSILMCVCMLVKMYFK